MGEEGRILLGCGLADKHRENRSFLQIVSSLMVEYSWVQDNSN